MKAITLVFALILVAGCRCQKTCDISENVNDTGRIATYDEILALPQKPEVLLIDVRQPEELEQEGKIPTAINIPCKFYSQINFI